MTRRSTTRWTERRFVVLQALIVFAVVAAVAAIALPVYAARAKDEVLLLNAHALKEQVQSRLALDPDGGFVADGDSGGGGDSVSATLARALRSGEAGRYVNPRSGSDAVVCQSATPASTGQARPAVWITDDEAAAYEALTAPGSGDALAGTLLVVFAGRDAGPGPIEVFYVDRDGQRSAEVATLTP